VAVRFFENLGRHFLRFLNLVFSTVGRTPWTGGRPIARPLPPQDSITQEVEDKHLCLEQDSNSRSQCPSGQDPRLSMARPLWSASKKSQYLYPSPPYLHQLTMHPGHTYLSFNFKGVVDKQLCYFILGLEVMSASVRSDQGFSNCGVPPRGGGRWSSGGRELFARGIYLFWMKMDASKIYILTGT
jgi:hypothetical protein